ncbi:MAG: serine O-acetyltransferase [Vallitalea sp.]|jgi:serine O-acetyltransferase|nr:serine O-acetyltransferase [Vallitalea sp.]
MGIIKFIKEEIEVIRDRDPAIKSTLEVFLYGSFKAILSYRFAHWLFKKKRYFLARWISQRAARKTGIEIHPGAVIGKKLFIDHGHGVVIGETCEIGDNVTIYQGVTLGGTGKEHGKRHPTIGNNVMISAGAKVLGSFKVGDNCRIGAGSVVLKEVLPDCTVVGIPARVVRRNNEKVSPCETLDQINFPDPLKMEMCKLLARLEHLEHIIEAIPPKDYYDLFKRNIKSDN